MKVSIITVTYNSEKYLHDCINSVRGQDYENIEHIIIDGKSTDNTLKIILLNEMYISEWISEPDRGMYDAINKGIALATGDIIGVLNSDDMFASADVISEIVSGFKYTNTDSIYGDLVYVNPGNPDKVFRYWKGLPYKRSRFKIGWMPAHPTFYIKRSVIEKYGNYENHYFTAADYEFMARYLYHHKVSSYYLPKMIVKMRNGGISNGSIYRRLRANRRDYLAMKKSRIPFAFIVSILKPLSKLPQYSKKLNRRNLNKNKIETPIIPSLSYFRVADHKPKISG
ncbi:MAG: glycosyltransferase [Bacteroidota bacterium]|nr:glycosyltransferase [Bacteroidota bacterium]